MKARNERLFIIGGIAFFVLAAFGLATYKLATFGYNGMDLAIYNNSFWLTVHGQLFGSSIHPPSYLGDHAEWLMLALAPVYALIPHPLTLVFLKLLALGSAAIPIWLFAKASLTEKKYAVLFPLLWLLSAFVWQAGLYEFNMIVFAVPLVLWAAYFFKRKRWGMFMLFLGLALLDREDVGISTVGFCAIALLEMIRERRWSLKEALKWIIVPGLLAVAVFFADQAVIRHFNPDGAYKFTVYYRWIADSSGGALGGTLTILKHLFGVTSWQFTLAFFIPTLFIAWARPRYLLLAVLPFIEYALTRMGMELFILQSQYVSLFLPALALATIEGFDAVMSKGALGKFAPRPILPIILIVASAWFWISYGPGHGLPAFFRPERAKVESLKSALAAIPSDASVMSSMELLTSLSSRAQVWPIVYSWIGKKQFGYSDYRLPALPDYVVIDKNDLVYFTLAYYGWPGYADADAKFSEFLKNGGYGVIRESEGVAVLKKGEGALLDFALVQNATSAKAIGAKCGPFEIIGTSEGRSFRPEASLFIKKTEEYSGDALLKIEGKYFPLGNGIYSPRHWKIGETVEIPLNALSVPKKIQLVELAGGLEATPLNLLILRIDKETPLCAPIEISK